MKTRTHINSRNSGFTAVRLAVCIAVATIGIGALCWWTFNHGGLQGVGSPSKFKWLTEKNAQATLHLKEGKAGTITAAPELPVLLVICPTAVAADKTLDLNGVSAALAGKVTVLALDPYADKAFTKAFNATFIDDSLTTSAAIGLARQLLQQQNKPVTKAAITQLLGDEQFIEYVKRQTSETPIFKAVYPKFFLFSAKSFDLAVGTLGIDNKDDVLAFVETGLSVLTAREASAAAAKSASSEPNASTEAATSAAAADATPASGTTNAATGATTTPATPAGTTPVGASNNQPAATPAPSAPAASPAPANAPASDQTDGTDTTSGADVN